MPDENERYYKVFGFFVSFVSSRNSATAVARDLCPLFPFEGTPGAISIPLFFALSSASFCIRRAVAVAGSFPTESRVLFVPSRHSR
jgi:hypothetical protein